MRVTMWQQFKNRGLGASGRPTIASLNAPARQMVKALFRESITGRLWIVEPGRIWIHEPPEEEE